MSVSIYYEPAERKSYYIGGGSSLADILIQRTWTEEDLPYLKDVRDGGNYKKEIENLIEGIEKFGSVDITHQY